MIFTTFTFLVFILIVLPLYFLLPHRAQNVMLLAASYVFYGWWDWRFLFLLLFSTVLDYMIGLGLAAPRLVNRRKALVTISIVTQLLLLGVFKYYDFFATSFATLASQFGWHVDPWLIQLVLPVGISFYTFHTLSYTIDIYRGILAPTRDFIAFALFISFFPQLVAGPIARARHLLPQMINPRHPLLTDWFEGCYLFYWGLFKKVVVADTLAQIVDKAFTNPARLNAFTVLVAVYAFAWQIYCDFSGYTDMARGCSKWFGIDLQINFKVPYLSVDPSDFWKRWHISLSSMLRDYLYIPLGGNRYGRTYRNLILTMLLGGLWHGANWTYALWGLYHGVLLVAYRLICPGLETRLKSPWARALHTIWFFHLVCLGWLIFRADSITQLAGLLEAFTRAPKFEPGLAARLLVAVPVFLLELAIYFRNDQVAFLRFPWIVRVVVYVGIYWALLTVGRWGTEGFIYFQF
ncbi:MAG TPA: MBOAT family O-acyltransferase [Fimbriiglobus sp.]|jgi:D-alanyl-lipoteichoic acid acyltransferase DltB (MBOAT superfamily)